MRVLSNWLDSYLELCTKSEAPYLFHKWLGISTIAACLQRKCYMEWEKIIYPNMFIIILGPSGRARKGTAMDISQYMLRGAGIKVASQAITREALIQEIKESVVTDIDMVTGMPDLHCSLTVFSKELGVFIEKSDQGTKMLSNLCDWFDCDDPWTYRTIGRGSEEIRGIWLNLVGATTPSNLQESLPRNAVGGGFLSRCILVYGESRKKIAYPILSNADKKLREELVRDLEEIRTMRGKFIATSDYIEQCIEWYEKVEEPPQLENDEIFHPYLSRRATHLRKISMITSAAESQEMVLTGENFVTALSYLEEVEAQMPKVFRGYGRSKYAEMLPRIMAAIGKMNYKEEIITESALYKLYYRDLIIDDFRAIITSLVKIGYITYAVKKINGKEEKVITYLKGVDDGLDDREL